MVHELKIAPAWYAAVTESDPARRKTVEIRAEDTRTFAVGDCLVLREWDAVAGYTGRACRVHVTHVLRDAPYVPPGYAALSIRLVDPPQPEAVVVDAATAERLRDWSRVLGCDPTTTVARALTALDLVLELAAQGGHLARSDWRAWHRRIVEGDARS
ncbi:MAG: DUF3850 domain-containing protein [Actinomycetia bacterium]|nr:DUF3850 domain-containing protein [Actinomycetes bacterium]